MRKPRLGLGDQPLQGAAPPHDLVEPLVLRLVVGDCLVVLVPPTHAPTEPETRFNLGAPVLLRPGEQSRRLCPNADPVTIKGEAGFVLAEPQPPGLELVGPRLRRSDSTGSPPLNPG